MRVSAFILIAMLVGCAVSSDEQTSQLKRIGVGNTSSAQGSDTVLSKCPNLKQIGF